MKYTDPSGNSINSDGDETRGDLFDCTIDELNALSWEIRASWISKLGEKSGAPGWFDNIQAVIQFFGSNAYFRGDPYVSLSDAALLWVIQEGYRYVFRGGVPFEALPTASKLWIRFFVVVNKPVVGLSLPELIERKRYLTKLWGAVEQEGTAFGLEYAESSGLAQPSGEAGAVWQRFLQVGNAYRNWQATDDSQAGWVSTPLNLLYWAVGTPTAKVLGSSPVSWGAHWYVELFYLYR